MDEGNEEGNLDGIVRRQPSKESVRNEILDRVFCVPGEDHGDKVLGGGEEGNDDPVRQPAREHKLTWCAAERVRARACVPLLVIIVARGFESLERRVRGVHEGDDVRKDAGKDVGEEEEEDNGGRGGENVELRDLGLLLERLQERYGNGISKAPCDE